MAACRDARPISAHGSSIIAKQPARRQGKHYLQIKYLARFPLHRRERLAHNAGHDAKTDRSGQRAPYPLAVIMERARLANRWATRAVGGEGRRARRGAAGQRRARDRRATSSITQILFPGFRAQAAPATRPKAIYLNLTSPEPKVFVLWRMRGRDRAARAAHRELSAKARAGWTAASSVDGVALPADLLPWIGEFVEAHYQPEPQKKKRYASSKDKGVASRRDGTSMSADATSTTVRDGREEAFSARWSRLKAEAREAPAAAAAGRRRARRDPQGAAAGAAAARQAHVRFRLPRLLPSRRSTRTCAARR